MQERLCLCLLEDLLLSCDHVLIGSHFRKIQNGTITQQIQVLHDGICPAKETHFQKLVGNCL